MGNIGSHVDLTSQRPQTSSAFEWGTEKGTEGSEMHVMIDA
jgi:hypothetical protein